MIVLEDTLIQNARGPHSSKVVADAQKELYERYAKAMYNTAFRILQNRQDAEDVLQEGFVQAFTQIDQFRGRSTFGAWLKRIMVNRAVNLVKQRARFTDEVEQEVPSETAQEDADYTVEQILAATAALPDGCRAVFCLKAFEGYDHTEIAEILDISKGTSKSQYSRAKMLMQELLTERKEFIEAPAARAAVSPQIG